MVIFHILAITAFWSFSWTNLAVALALHWIAVGFGISLGYHRLHTHRGFRTSKAFEYFLAICGTLTLEGGPMFWVATHRQHHQLSDQEGDPHSPRDGGFWAHMGWILFGDTHHNNPELMGKYAPDLGREPFDFCEQVVGQAHPGLRCSCLDLAMDGIGHVSDLDHSRHAFSMLTC